MRQDATIVSTRFLNEAEVALVKRAAQASGMNLSAFIREVMIKRSNDVLALEHAFAPSTADKAGQARARLTVIKGGKK